MIPSKVAAPEAAASRYTELWGVTAERNRAKRRDAEEMQRLTDEGASGI